MNPQLNDISHLIGIRVDPIGRSTPRLMNRVLIIDNSETDSFMLRQLLQVMGHSAEVVTSTREAKANLASYAPHFVICSQSLLETDQSLLRMSSRGEHPSPCVFVALSDGDTSIGGQPAIPPGFHRQLTKPIEILQLQELMGDYPPDDQSVDRRLG